jgi:transposase
LAPIVQALQTLRGVELIVAVTFAGEVGDVQRFESPRQLMCYLGLVPQERSTAETVRRDGITKAGNGRVRHMLVESAWTYRHPPGSEQKTLPNGEGPRENSGRGALFRWTARDIGDMSPLIRTLT